MPNLTKRGKVISIAEEVGITQDQTFAVIQKTLDHIIESLALGHNVELRNFGVFEVRLTKQRVGRNPNKPEADVPIPAFPESLHLEREKQGPRRAPAAFAFDASGATADVRPSAAWARKSLSVQGLTRTTYA